MKFLFKKKNQKIQQKNFSSFSTIQFLGNANSGNIEDVVSSYSKNVVVYRAVNLLASSAASVPWKLYQYDNHHKIELHEHDLLNLLNKPNHKCSGAEFFKNVFANYLIFGEAFIYVLSHLDKPHELHLLDPKKISLEHDSNGNLVNYVYSINNKRKVKYSVDKISGKSDILHVRSFNPSGEDKGISPLMAASFCVEQHNEASKWNLSMLKNSARPSGALVLKNNDNGSNFIPEHQFEDIKSQIESSYISSKNTGKPLLLQGGLEWQELSLSPKDMDFIEAKHSSAREIALSFGVPPQLLGIPGDNTYNNMQEARLALWEETIIPMLDSLTDNLNRWLAERYANNIKISNNLDAVSALSLRQEKLWNRLEKSSFLTINEKRRKIGLSTIEGGDVL